MSTEVRCTEDELKNWLMPILEKEGLEVYDIVISGNTEKGDGYLGDITFVEVNGCNNEKEQTTFRFVVKCGKKSTSLRDTVPIRLAFENEIHFCNVILPAYKKFQEEKGIKEPFDNFPKCFGTLLMDDMEVLVLDNLNFKDFSVHNRKQPMDKEHILKVVRTYGKLHAISYALKDQQPVLFKQLACQLGDVFAEFSKLSLRSETPRSPLQDVVDVAIEENRHDIAEKADNLKDIAINAYKITDPDDPYAIILHGDCWNNNFMFKYADKKKSEIQDVSLIDFQLSKLASPVYDLSYFLFTCLSPDDVKDFDEIIQTYYESLSNFLRLLGSDPNKMFPFEELMNQWKKFYIFGVVQMAVLVKASLSEPDEVVNLSEIAESDQSFDKAFSYTIRNIEEYKRRIFAIMDMLLDKQII